ncbi:MAG: alpha/beta hydrolase [Lentisphaeria bacterium]|nr:alpha/beta hydrolase [Lentisphaeria bacterium]NQZ67792.1 alpha/beta hydrolase [Lentisphaeria bacterium]
MSDKKEQTKLTMFMWILFRFACIYIVLIIALVIFENKLIFIPAKYPDGDWTTEVIKQSASSTVTVSDVFIQTADDVKIHAFYFEPAVSEYVILYCHGNAGNIADRKSISAALTEIPASVLSFDYRGYGRSEGSPNEQGVYLDAEAAWDYLTQTKKIKAENIIIFGVSLGAAVAIELAKRHPDARLLVTESAFTSLADMATRQFPFLPKFVVRANFNNLEKIKSNKIPYLQFHGIEDTLVPISMARQLHRASTSKYHWYHEIKEAGHNEVMLYTKNYISIWKNALEASDYLKKEIP